jgi:hypothetical protein
MSRARTLATALVAAIFGLLPQGAHACAVCLGGQETDITKPMNAAIFVMLGCIGAMLALVGGVAFHFSRRASKLPPSGSL